MADDKGKQLGKYRIEKRLGQGGMGIVFEATDTKLLRKVALKVLPKHLAARRDIAQRFLREARIAAGLNHPHVVTVHDADEQSGYCFMVMELLTGGNAQELLKSGGLEWREATRIIADACRGLTAAHAAGLIHRDIKPANIMRNADGLVKLADFGLAKITDRSMTTLTQAGSIMGTPHFMSPEQCRGETLDERSDLYSLGATYYTLLTGRTPYVAEGTVQTMFAHCSKAVPDPRHAVLEIPDACAAIVARAMAKPRGERFNSAFEMLAALTAALQDNTLDAETPTIPPVGSDSGQRPQLFSLAPNPTAVLAPARTSPQDVTETFPKPAMLSLPPQRDEVPTAKAADEPLMPVRARRVDSRNRKQRLIVPIGAALGIVLMMLGVTAMRSRDNRPAPFRASRPITLEFERDLAVPAVAGEVRGVAFSRDDRFLYIAGGDALVRKWDLAKDTSVREYRGQQGAIKALALSADGRWLAAGGVDQAINVWSEAGKEAWREMVSQQDITALQFSPDARHLAVGTHGGVRLYEVSKQGTLQLHKDLANSETRPLIGYIVHGVAFSPDGRTLAAVSHEHNAVGLWEVATGKLLDKVLDQSSQPDAVTFCGTDGQVLFAGGNGAIYRWLPLSQQPPERIGEAIPDVRAIALAPNGRTLVVVGTWGGPMRLVDLENQGPPREIKDSFPGTPYCVAFARAGSRLVTGGGYNSPHAVPGEMRSAVKLWRVREVSSSDELPGK